MDKEFTVDLTHNQADFLTTLLPKSNSIQLYEKSQRRRKAEKKLDDMYVSEFSLRPVKKIKKDPQNHHYKHQKLINPTNNSQFNQALTNSSSNNHNPPQLKEGQKELKKPQDSNQKVEKNEIKMQKEVQIFQPHTSRSQRVSKPTVAYLQFQQETFKKKIAERTQPKEVSTNVQNSLQYVSRPQPQPERRRQQTKDQGEKMQLQKQPSSQLKLKQPIEQKSQQKIISGANISTQYYGQPQSKQKTIQIPFTLPQNSLSQLIHPSQPKSPQNNERNLPSVQPQFYHNNIAIQENLQNSQQRMPRHKTKQKLPNTLQNPTNSLPGLRSAKNHHKLEEREANYQKRCWGILERLKIHKSSWPFRHPVDPQTQGVPDYFQKIKNPMDLKSIEKKLRGDKYKSGEEFYADVNLMLQNSFQYNLPTTKYYKLTVELEEYFKQLKTKSQLLKSLGKNSTENDEEQSDYEIEEQNGQIIKKAEQKVTRERVENDQKGERAENGKRTVVEYENNLTIPVVNRKIAKVFITSEGPMRKDKKAETQNEINKSNVKNQTQGKPNEQINLNLNQSTKKTAQVKQIYENNSNNKQLKAIQIQSSKKQSPCDQYQGAVAHTQSQKQSRFGYPQNKISFMQRQILRYDILHIEQPTIRNQLESFLEGNHEMFKKFKHTQNQRYPNDNNESKQRKGNEMTCQNESYEIELKDLDQESYKVLRLEVDRLMRQEKECIKSVVDLIIPEIEHNLMKE